MEEESGRSELRRMQREQERERRRIRDRQRRQSMTVEQREKHLARRRRNYQLRRLRAENVRNETITVNEHQAVISVSGPSDQCNSVPHVQINQGQEKLIVDRTKSEGLEALAHKSAHFQRTLRLSHVRHLARTLNHSMAELTGNSQVVAAVVNKGDVTNNRSQVGDSDSGRSLQSLRLNRVKRLARTVNNTANSVIKEATGQSDQSGAEVQPKLPWGGDTAGN
ncbi:hypothetical protein ACJW30_05G159300 [Castanea mollissima]